MNVQCSNCPAKYAISDAKIKGRKVKITCKKCNTPIIVDGTKVSDEGETAAPVRKARAIKQTVVGGFVAPQGAAPAPPAAPPEPAAPAASPEPAAPAASEEPEWTVAVTEEDQREMSTEQVTAAYADGEVDQETFIWKDGMDDWLTPFEIPAIAAALEARGLSAGAGADAADEEQAAPDADPPGAAWQEPGKTPPPSDDFEEPTVAGELTEEMLKKASGPSEPPDETADEPEDDGFDIGGADDTGLVTSAAPDPAEEAPAAPIDLFGGAASAGSEDSLRDEAQSTSIRASAAPDATGVRNESSVLFSLDALKGGPMTTASAPEPDQEMDFLIDAPPSKEGGASLLAAPDLTAPAGAPIDSALGAPDLSAPEKGISPSQAPSQAPPDETKEKKTIVGLVALILLAVAGTGGYFLTRGNVEPTAPVEAVQPAPEQVVDTPAATPEPTPSASAEANDTPAPGASQDPASQDPQAAPQAAAKRTAPKLGAAAKTGVSKAEAEKKEEKPVEEAAPFNTGAAKRALSSAAANASASCKKPGGPTGKGRVSVTFMPSGRATRTVVGGDFAGTSTGGCIARVFRGARIPKFSGNPKKVSKTVRIQ